MGLKYDAADRWSWRSPVGCALHTIATLGAIAITLLVWRAVFADIVFITPVGGRFLSGVLYLSWFALAVILFALLPAVWDWAWVRKDYPWSRRKRAVLTAALGVLAIGVSLLLTASSHVGLFYFALVLRTLGLAGIATGTYCGIVSLFGKPDQPPPSVGHDAPPPAPRMPDDS